MDIIGVEGFPVKLSAKQAIAILLKMLNVKFEGLNFEPASKGSKTFYINIIDNVDPRECIETINNKAKGKIRLHAFFPSRAPYVIGHKLSKKSTKKQSKLKAMRNTAIKIPPAPMPKEKMVVMTRNDLLYEMHDIYTGLEDLCSATNNKLLFELGKAIEERLRIVVDDPYPAIPDCCFLLSKHYRFKHKHETDLELIRACHKKAGGSGEVSFQDLKQHPRPEDSMLDNMPVKIIQTACNRYAGLITEQVTKHINALEMDTSGAQTEEVTARNKVREQLKKLVPAVQPIVSECLARQLIPETSYGGVLRVYGVPFLPTREKCEVFLKPFSGKQFRSQHLFNCIHVQVPNMQVPVILKADDTVIDGRHLLVRRFHKEHSKAWMKKVNKVMSGNANLDDADKEDDKGEGGQMDNEEEWEIWGEEQ